MADNRLTALPEGVVPRASPTWSDLIFQWQRTDYPARRALRRARQAADGFGWVANRLTALPEGVFRGLSSLEVLRIGPSPLDALPERIFAGLSRLRILDLANAELTALLPGVFAGLAALKKLWLHGNELHSLPAGVFTGLSGFTNLELYDNPGSPFTLTLRPVRAGQPMLGEAVAVQVRRGPRSTWSCPCRRPAPRYRRARP